MASTVWKGYLTFGLISVPIRLFAAARRESVSFNMLHGACGTRIKQQLFCPSCERVVERDEIVKGYQETKDSYVIVEPDELKNIAPPSEHNMDIVQFVKLEEVDPIYFDASYYVMPDDPGRKAYGLLVHALERSGYAAIAQVAMHNREYLVIIRPKENGLTLHTAYYKDELNELAEYGHTETGEVKPQEVQLAEKLIENLAAPFEPEKFHDEYSKRVLELIEAKREGKSVQAVKQPKVAPVGDLMEALQRSLAAATRKGPEKAEGIRAVPAKAAAKKAPARKRGAA
ncbi:MAG TPA: Ku protein [Bryobacteraceae bacterium]|nr:Ku protein [Bryobacteraceae bacterium]